jgi:hypothetical protein
LEFLPAPPPEPPELPVNAVPEPSKFFPPKPPPIAVEKELKDESVPLAF